MNDDTTSIAQTQHEQTTEQNPPHGKQQYC